MTVPARDDLAAVLDSVSDLIGGVEDEQWGAPTPCPEWDVRLLVNHMVLGHQLFTGILRGTTTASPDALDPSTDDVLGDNPTDAYRRATNDVLAAFAQPGVLEREFHVPAGVVPGIAAVHLRAVEELAHGWDLARATDQRPPFPHDIVERELAFTRTKLADMPPDQSPFAPPQPVPDDAPPLDRLAALLGRRTRPRR